MDNSRTQVVEVNTTNESGVGIASVEKTPFEIKLNQTYPDGGYDYFPIALDAKGDILPYGEYMDELKGYYYSDDYEQKKADKSFKELLDERAVYKTEVTFEK